MNDSENSSNEDGAMNLGDLTERAEKLRWSYIFTLKTKLGNADEDVC